jgi:hypothetical protein
MDIELAEEHSYSAPKSSFPRQVAGNGNQRFRPNGSVLCMPVLINHVIGSKDHAHTHIARQFFEAKQCGPIRQPGHRQAGFPQMRSQIVIPQGRHIAANRGREDACAVQFGRERPTLRETFVKNRSMKREVRTRSRLVSGRNRHFDKRSGYRCRTNFQDTSAVDHLSSRCNLCR